MNFAPLALTKIGAAVTAASSVLSTISGMQQASFQSKVAANNAAIAERNAAQATENTQTEQLDYAEAAREQIGALIAQQGASGVSAASGSPFLQAKRAKALARRDAERIAREGATRVRGLQQQSADFSTSAQKPRGLLLGGLLDFGTTLIGGAEAIQKVKGLVK